MDPITVLLVEDHNIVRQSIRLLLDQEPDLTVVGEAVTAVEACQMARELRPNVVVMDIGLPGDTGVEATARITLDLPDTHVVALTMHAEDAYVLAMLRAGAEGYLTKDCLASDLARTIRTVSKGQAMLCAEATKSLIDAVDQLYPSRPHAEIAISKREHEILRLIAEGDTSQEIGRKLFLSLRTVSNCRSELIKKLGARNASEAAVFACQLGLI